MFIYGGLVTILNYGNYYIGTDPIGGGVMLYQDGSSMLYQDGTTMVYQ